MIDWQESLLWSAARYRASLDLEISRIDASLSIYWASASGIAPTPVGRYMLRHQSDREACTCTLCTDWRIRRVEVERVLPLMDGHRWGNCGCPICTVGRHLHFGFLGATNRRDLWTEMAYHAHTDAAYSRKPDAVLRVVRAELEDPKRNLRWWALSGAQLPMSFWFTRIDKALGIRKEKKAA